MSVKVGVCVALAFVMLVGGMFLVTYANTLVSAPSTPSVIFGFLIYAVVFGSFAAVLTWAVHSVVVHLESHPKGKESEQK